MDDDRDLRDEKIRRFFEEDVLNAKINRAYFGLEIRITVDHLLHHSGAKLVSQQGKSIDIRPKTVEQYWKLQSLIYDYTKMYGKNQGIEEIKNKWATPARKSYYH